MTVNAADYGFETVGGVLLVGGLPLPQLVERIGSTPFYAYDRRAISQRMAELRRSMPSSLRISYAVKANPMPAVVQHLASLVDGFDVASAGEMHGALNTPIKPASISFSGPGKSAEELQQAIAAGVLINVESRRELETIASFGNRSPRPRVAIRVNPDFQLRGSGMRMGGGAQPFGIDAEAVPAVLARIAELPVTFDGFHVFAGSQNLNANVLVEAHEKTVDFILALSRHAKSTIREVIIGGGMGIPYAPHDLPLDSTVVAAGLAHQVERIGKALPQAAVTLELGRYIVGESGIYVCRVVDRKESGGAVFLITDGGMHHHLAASGNLGQVIRRNFPIAIGTKMSETVTERVNVHGPLCTPLDVLAKDLDTACADVGDLVVVFQSGAYGATASPRDFLSHPHPREVLV